MKNRQVLIGLIITVFLQASSMFAQNSFVIANGASSPIPVVSIAQPALVKPPVAPTATIPWDAPEWKEYYSLKAGFEEYQISFREIRQAADELAKYLKQICGKDVKRIHGIKDIPEAAIVVGQACPEALQTEAKKLGKDGFIIRTEGQKLFICGGGRQGTLYGVYSFLEDVLGCRWWAYDSEFVPSKPEIKTGQLDIKSSPPFLMHDLYNMEAQTGKNNMVWKTRSRGTFQPTGNHNMYNLLAPYAAKKPEYWPYVETKDKKTGEITFKGRRVAKDVGDFNGGVIHFNYLAPGMPEDLAEALERDIFKRNGNLEDFLYFAGQGDWYGGLDQSPESLKLYESEAWTDPDGDRRGASVAGLLQLMNKTREIISKKYPAAKIGTFAYMSTDRPPQNMKPAENVYIWLPRLRYGITLSIEEAAGDSKVEDSVADIPDYAERIPAANDDDDDADAAKTASDKKKAADAEVAKAAKAAEDKKKADDAAKAVNLAADKKKAGKNLTEAERKEEAARQLAAAQEARKEEVAKQNAIIIAKRKEEASKEQAAGLAARLEELAQKKNDTAKELSIKVFAGNRRMKHSIEQWARIAPGRLLIWDYGTNYINYMMPTPNLRAMAQNIKYYHRIGARGLLIQGNYSSTGGDLVLVKNYVWRKLMWNPELDIEVLIKEFCDGYYGPASQEVMNYINILENSSRTPVKLMTDEYNPNPPYLTSEVVSKMKAALGRATSKVQGDENKVYLQRVHEVAASLEARDLWIKGTLIEKDGRLIRADIDKAKGGSDTFERARILAKAARGSGVSESSSPIIQTRRLLSWHGGPLYVLKGGNLTAKIAPSQGIEHLWQVLCGDKVALEKSMVTPGSDLFDVVGTPSATQIQLKGETNYGSWDNIPDHVQNETIECGKDGVLRWSATLLRTNKVDGENVAPRVESQYAVQDPKKILVEYNEGNGWKPVEPGTFAAKGRPKRSAELMGAAQEPYIIEFAPTSKFQLRVSREDTKVQIIDTVVSPNVVAVCAVWIPREKTVKTFVWCDKVSGFEVGKEAPVFKREISARPY